MCICITYILISNSTLNMTNSSERKHAIFSKALSMINFDIKAEVVVNMENLLDQNYFLIHHQDYNNNDWTIVHYLASFSHEDPQYYQLFKLFIRKGFNMNTRDLEGDTPLHIAVSHWNVKAVNILLDEGADTSQTNDRNQTPIQVVIDMNKNTGMIIESLFNSKSKHHI